MNNDSKSIGKNIGILCRQLNIFLNHELEQYDISASEIMYLGSLFMEDGVPQDKFVNEFCIDKAAVARAISSLENKGLVRRESSQKDKRSKLVFLTEKSHEYKEILSSIQNKWEQVFLNNLSEKEISDFARILEEIGSSKHYDE